MPTTRRIVWRGRTLRILALGFAGFGLAYVARAPEMAGLTGIVLPTRTASIDFAATYGGAQLGLAIFLAFCARERSRYRLGLLAGGWTLIGIGGVRLVELVLPGGAVAPVMYAGLAIELAAAALAFLMAGKARPAHPDSPPASERPLLRP